MRQASRTQRPLRKERDQRETRFNSRPDPTAARAAKSGENSVVKTTRRPSPLPARPHNASQCNAKQGMAGQGQGPIRGGGSSINTGRVPSSGAFPRFRLITTQPSNGEVRSLSALALVPDYFRDVPHQSALSSIVIRVWDKYADRSGQILLEISRKYTTSPGPSNTGLNSYQLISTIRLNYLAPNGPTVPAPRRYLQDRREVPTWSLAQLDARSDHSDYRRVLVLAQFNSALNPARV